jgi:hypothetical protein
MEEMNQLKVFTVEEANRFLPRLTELIHELQHKRNTVLSLEVEIDALELVADSKEQSSKLVDKKVEEYNNLLQSFYGLIDEIHEKGCFLKDVNAGLVDFQTLYNGRSFISAGN